MNLVVDQNIRGAAGTFGRHADLTVMDGRDIRAADIRNADALIVRTSTRVDRTLLHGSRVGFVGTTSIGTDHLDIDWLERKGIAWASAPGCNADSAAQYTLAMMWLACDRLGRKLGEQRVGIVGCGNVGSRLRRLLTALGVQTVANDPPLAEQGVEGLVSLEAALDQDIVSLHVPLTREGAHRTWRFIAKPQLARLPDGALLVNTARGDVLDGDILLAELGRGRLHAALDVWPGEPRFSRELLDSSTVATPHVAGYSDDGKWNGTWMVYLQFCRWAGLTPVDAGGPSSGPFELAVAPGENAVDRALDAACFVGHHDSEMRRLSALSAGARAQAFDLLRRDYPPRRDFHAWSIRCPDPSQAAQLGRLGFAPETRE